MAVLPDLDAIGLEPGVMFEKADSFSDALRPPLARRAEDGARLRGGAGPLAPDRAESRSGSRADSRPARRAGDALRAVEWSEITARLNAARDFRLLLRSESQGRIEAVAASFGDAAASYFAMIEQSERAVNLDALDCSKACDGMEGADMDVLPAAASGGDVTGIAEASGGDVRDTQ